MKITLKYTLIAALAVTCSLGFGHKASANELDGNIIFLNMQESESPFQQSCQQTPEHRVIEQEAAVAENYFYNVNIMPETGEPLGEESYVQETPSQPSQAEQISCSGLLSIESVNI